MMMVGDMDHIQHSPEKLTEPPMGVKACWL